MIDVRSPGEFAKGHITGAVNLPMLDDNERAAVGIAYKQRGRHKAIVEALEVIGPKMAPFVHKVTELFPGREVLLHCWRGGMRSDSTAWLLRTTGMSVSVLKNGYKAYRRAAHESFEQGWKLHVIGGRTGSGKTEILHALGRMGEQIVDLEGLANHRGSVFGGLNMPDQPTVEQFENNLFEALRVLDPSRPVWVEDESHSIGRVYVPMPFYKQKQQAVNFQVKMSADLRAERLVRDYGEIEPEKIVESLHKISKRLGGQRLKECLKAVEVDDRMKLAKIALEYYDKAYSHSLENNITGELRPFQTEIDDPELIAKGLIELSKASNIAT